MHRVMQYAKALIQIQVIKNSSMSLNQYASNAQSSAQSEIHCLLFDEIL